jgi:hypothetical protein
MRKKTLLALAVLSAMALVAVAPAFAQDRVEAKIPFAFNVGSKSLPAGDYEVRRLMAKTLAIQNEATQQAAIVLTMVAPPNDISSEAVLVFHKYGDRCFLSEVQTADGRQTLTASKLEREVAEKTAETADNTPDREVYVAARIR